MLQAYLPVPAFSYIPSKWKAAKCHTGGCGRAVVATDAGDIPYLIDNGKTGFVVSQEDEATLADCIAMLLADRDSCRRMGNAGWAKAEQLFGLDRLRFETFAAYRAEGWGDR